MRNTELTDDLDLHALKSSSGISVYIRLRRIVIASISNLSYPVKRRRRRCVCGVEGSSSASRGSFILSY